MLRADLRALPVLRVTQQEIRARIAEEHASTAAAPLPLPPATAAALVQEEEPIQAEELRALLAPPGGDARNAPRSAA